MARELSVNHETMRKLVVEDLGLKSFKRKTVHHLNPSIRTKRLARSKTLLQRFAPGAQDQILFSEEKFFTIEEAWNRQNDRILATSSTAIPENLKYMDRVQKPITLFCASCQSTMDLRNFFSSSSMENMFQGEGNLGADNYLVRDDTSLGPDREEAFDLQCVEGSINSGIPFISVLRLGVQESGPSQPSYRAYPNPFW
ncbi:Transposase [Oopsacas minuta]|uniref:Transposase n=1 Tax=Oopsacas minuta TaxID=111878 RepID=A0AAV7JJG0_9METZ|nr:Transposase [Oopsacas minuta]